MMHTRDGHPDTGSPHTIVRTMMNRIMKKDSPQNTIPMTDARERGATENPVIPSREYRKSLRTDHFVSPAARSTFSYSSHFVSKPTHSKIPFEKRLYSLISSTASTILRLIRR